VNVTIGSSPTRLEAPPETAVRPVMLATLDLPYAAEAIAFAIETAVETRAELLVVDVIPLHVGNPSSAMTRTLGDPDVRDDQRRVGLRAEESGAVVRLLVFNHPRPLRALVDVAREQGVGLIVFGPDRGRYGRWRFRRAARRLRSSAGCLVWPFD
jgi:hypothetical protein